MSKRDHKIEPKLQRLY